jgi:hypothetical protein
MVFINRATIVGELVMVLASLSAGCVLIFRKPQRRSSFPRMERSLLRLSASGLIQLSCLEEPIELLGIDPHARPESHDASLRDQA